VRLGIGRFIDEMWGGWALSSRVRLCLECVISLESGEDRLIGNIPRAFFHSLIVLGEVEEH